MKKILLMSGALLSIGVLASCSSKQAKNVDMALKEYDAKFALPNGLYKLQDTEFAQYIVECATENLAISDNDNTSPARTTYEHITNVNAAVKNIATLLDQSDYSEMGFKKEGEKVSINGEMVFNGKTIPIDTSACYRDDVVSSMSLYRNNITEYKISHNSNYINEAGFNLHYKSNDTTYNYWYVKNKETGQFDVKNYVNESSIDSMDERNDYYMNVKSVEKEDDVKKALRVGSGEVAYEMYEQVLGATAKDTYVPNYNENSFSDVSNLVNKLDLGGNTSINQVKGGFPLQLQFYRSEDYKTVYAYSSSITGKSYTYPSNAGKATWSSQGVDPSKIIPIYSVETRIAKITHFGNGISDWRIDYAGLLGKTFAAKDNNLTVYDKPKCVGSEYYIASSIYGRDQIGDLKEPILEGVNEYKLADGVENITGFGLNSYNYKEYQNYYYETDKEYITGKYYDDLSTQQGIVDYFSLSSIYNTADSKKYNMRTIEETVDVKSGFSLSDLTDQYVSKGYIEDDHAHLVLSGQFQFYKHSSQSIEISPEEGIVGGGTSLSFALMSEDDDGNLIAPDLRDGKNAAINGVGDASNFALSLYPNQDPTKGYMVQTVYGIDAREEQEEKNKAYVLQFLPSTTYYIEVIIKFTGEEGSKVASLESLSLSPYNSGGGGVTPAPFPGGEVVFGK